MLWRTSLSRSPRGRDREEPHGSGSERRGRVGRRLEVALRLRAVDELRAHRVADDGVGDGIAVAVEGDVVVVRVRVTRLVVAGVVLLARGAAPDGRFLRRLDAFGAGEQATRRDPLGDERTVVGPPT